MLLQRCTPQGQKIGVLVVGGAPTDNIEYSLIKKQFECIAEYLNWDIRFCKTYYATEKDDLAKNSAAIEEIKKLGATVE